MVKWHSIYAFYFLKITSLNFLLGMQFVPVILVTNTKLATVFTLHQLTVYSTSVDSYSTSVDSLLYISLLYIS